MTLVVPDGQSVDFLHYKVTTSATRAVPPVSAVEDYRKVFFEGLDNVDFFY